MEFSLGETKMFAAATFIKGTIAAMIIAKLNDISAAIAVTTAENVKGINEGTAIIQQMGIIGDRMNRARELAKLDMEIDEKFGFDNQANIVCHGAEQGAAWQDGMHLMAETAFSIMEAMLARSDDRFANRQQMHDDLWTKLKERGKEWWEYIRDMDAHESAISIELDELAEMVDVLTSIYNAMPPLPSPDTDTQAGQDYEIQKYNYLTKHAFYSGIIANYLRERAANIEALGDWPLRKWAEIMGGTDSLPPGISRQRRISMMTLRWLHSKYRMASVEYFDPELAVMEKRGVLEDLASNFAVSIEFKRKKVELLDKMNLIAALRGMERVDELYGDEVERLYQRVYLVGN